MKKRAFTLVELLAVMVILGVILAITVPKVQGVIDSSKKNSFEVDLKTILDKIVMKQSENANYDIENLSTTNMESDLDVNSDNYKYLSAFTSNSKLTIYAVGKNKWDGLAAYGTRDNIKFFNADAEGEMIATPDSCFTFDSATGTITDYAFDDDQCLDDVTIPSTINNVTVEHIAPGAFVDTDFQYCRTEEEEVGEQLPKSYVHTDTDGYVRCYFSLDDDEYGRLTSIDIPNTVTSIGYYAFAYNQIRNATISNKVSTIPSHAFYRNDLWRSTIPDGVTAIGESAFAYNQIEYISLPSTLTTIDKYAFERNQLTNLIIPSSVTSIGSTAFNSNQLTSLTIPNSLTYIDDWVFGSNQLTSVNIPSSITSIGDGTFENNQLKSITIPNSVTTIDPYAFYQNQLASLAVPNSVTSIGDYAFAQNLIPQGSATIDNNSSNVSVPSSAFNWNGSDGWTDITPVYLR